MITKLVGLVSGGKLTELQVKIAVMLSRLAIVAALCMASFVGGCSYKASSYEKASIKQIERAGNKAAKELSNRTKEVVADERQGQRKIEEINRQRDAAIRSVSSDPDCVTTPDELQHFNELAKAAGN